MKANKVLKLLATVSKEVITFDMLPTSQKYTLAFRKKNTIIQPYIFILTTL